VARIGQAAVSRTEQPLDDQTRWRLAGLVGPVIRDRHEDPEGALAWWRAAGAAIARPDWRAACAVEAAEVAVEDLQQLDQAKPLLDFAAARLSNATGETASRMHRLRGDWLAGKGDASGARAAYAQAEAARRLGKASAERDAWRGAHSRSADFFLRSGELERARDELRRWRLDYPADKIEGYMSLLWARYWVAKGRPQLAIRAANELLVVNPRSPYADQLLFMAARCEQQLGRPDRAAAAYQSLIADYPGSPLVAEAGARWQELRGEDGHADAAGQSTNPPAVEGPPPREKP
jgi:TolA-binding protein